MIAPFRRLIALTASLAILLLGACAPKVVEAPTFTQEQISWPTF